MVAKAITVFLITFFTLFIIGLFALYWVVKSEFND